MNGIEKITERIEGDAQREIDAVLNAARAEAEGITQRYQAQAGRESADLVARGEKAAAERVERLGSVAQLEARKLALAAKQEMLDRAFELALQKLCTLPDEEYIDLLAALTVKAAQSGKEQVIFSRKDRSRVGKAVVTRANEMLAKQVAPKLPDELTDTKAGAILDRVVTGASAILAGTGMLTLAEETRPIRGGVILSDGDVEVNCTFETLVRLQREAMSGEVAKALFD
ncbi:V-type ATP synthase subunit E [Pseudoflavonifractor phocaeensis]|mgnify:FL=1|uniref:V-type ATP synthase subunit E n=1 Tax=Pseudoflavonifractor phocaeensis TaxID=1870988 RepID=UPI00210EBEFE|nr:V-type ATP synthase subunit E family protein [Pseudoflavonifractor phocaeensis]MCQ4864572.1 V-type ATP synthase subunit E family protein [Pseudoflavonifractor phocaeensis]